jgi:hypothetical protein
MSRRSHRHGDRGHGRPPRLELTHPTTSAPAPGPAETSSAPDGPISTALARPTVPAPSQAATVPSPLSPQAASLSQMPVAPVAVGPSIVTTPVAIDRVERAKLADGAAALDPSRPAGCTSPQLRRFIKSRAYIPLHELRRRFAINGPEDDVAAIDLDGTRLYVGLPERESRLLGELLRGGDVGAELSHDPVTPIIVGVYPMRPVPRG